MLPHLCGQLFFHLPKPGTWQLAEVGFLLRNGEFMSGLQEILAGATTVHHGHMPEIEITSDSTATGIWALHDIVIWPTGTRLDGYGAHVSIVVHPLHGGDIDDDPHVRIGDRLQG